MLYQGMSKSPKVITILGGSSVWTPQLLRFLSKLDIAPGLQIRLHGRSRTHLDEMASFAKNIVKKHLELGVFPRIEEAIRGSNIILCQVRIGGWRARLNDEKLPIKLGGVGDESLGAGGIRAANRSWPFVQKLARLVHKFAPDTWILNLTNPCDLIGRALREAGCSRVIGLCEHPQVFMQHLAAKAGHPEAAGKFEFFGIMHVGWAKPPAELEGSFLSDLQSGLSGWLQNWQALPTPWRVHLSDPGSLMRTQRCSPGHRTAFLMKLVDGLRRSIRNGDFHEYRTVVAKRDLPWFPMAVIPAIRALLGDKPARLVVGLANDHRFPGLHPNVQVEGWAILNECGVHPEPFNIGQRCVEDILQFGQTRDIAYSVAGHPDSESLELYLRVDPFVHGFSPRKDIQKLLELKDNRPFRKRESSRQSAPRRKE
ncbi:MAG: hypothetical protein JXA73_18995 [Acidobacteria bacterium]|nr:hypothetical protein [Acidobacteriota bacterium]